MRKQQIFSACLVFLLLLGLCACTQQPAEPKPKPTQTVTPSPVVSDTPALTVEVPMGRQLIASDPDGNIHLYAEENGTLFMEWGNLQGPVDLSPNLTNYYDPPAEWNAEQLFFCIYGGYEQDGIFCVPFVLDSESSLLLSGRLHWYEDQGIWSCKIPRIEIPDEPEDFLLPVYSNTMAGGYNDIYAVLDNGKLLMWGEPEFTYGLRGGKLGGTPTVLMENAAAIYTSVRGVIMAVDKEGTLWQFDALEQDPYEPVWIMDDVAMVSAEFMRTLILKRDGTLYEWEFSNRDSQQAVDIPEPVVYAASSGYRCQAVTADGSLWEWDFGPEGFPSTDTGKTVDWTKYRYGISEDNSVPAQGTIIPNAVQATYYWVLQEDGTLWHTGNERENQAAQVILDEVARFGLSERRILVKKSDGSYWSADFGWGFGSDVDGPLEFVRVYPSGQANN